MEAQKIAKYIVFSGSVCFLTPFAFLEGLVFGLFYLVAALVLLFLSLFSFCFTNTPWRLFLQFIREACLVLAATLTLLIPCCILRIFRDYEDGDWELAPLCTIFGDVDSRRFFTLACCSHERWEDYKDSPNDTCPPVIEWDPCYDCCNCGDEYQYIA